MADIDTLRLARGDRLQLRMAFATLFMPASKCSRWYCPLHRRRCQRLGKPAI